MTDVEARVLGCLIEKQWTTPDQYPLTLNALVAACNQTSNRSPVVHYDDETVESGVRSLKQKGLARFVHPVHGRSALRYEHRLPDSIARDDAFPTLLAVLLLRGPQTVGELRSRVQRLRPVGDLGSAEAALAAMARSDPPMAWRLPRRHGQKEDRYIHALGDPGSAAAHPGGEGRWPSPVGILADTATADERVWARGPAPTGGEPHGDDGIESRLAAVEEAVASIRHDLADIRTALGMDGPVAGSDGPPGPVSSAPVAPDAPDA